MALEAAIDGLRTDLSAMTGLSRTYDDPPESISQFPSLIVYARQGEIHQTSAGMGYSLHTLIAEIVMSRQYMPQVIDAAKVWPDRAFAILRADQTLNGSVSHIVWPFRYRIVPVRYNDIIHLVCQIEVQVKINESW